MFPHDNMYTYTYTCYTCTCYQVGTIHVYMLSGGNYTCIHVIRWELYMYTCYQVGTIHVYMLSGGNYTRTCYQVGTDVVFSGLPSPLYTCNISDHL